MAIAGLDIDPSFRYTSYTVDPSHRRLPRSADRTDSYTQVAAAMTANGLIPDYAIDLNSAKSNISQSEYAFKHRLLFETSRRNKIKRLRERGERSSGVPRKRLRVFTPLGEKSLPSVIRETQEFIYDTDLRELQENTKNSIIEVEDAEIRFLLIPTRCSSSRKVTFSIMEEETTLEVDACRVRWESLSVRMLQPERQKIRVTCKDCASKGVTYSAPYLNIITTTVPRKRMRRRPGKPKDKNRPLCSRKPLTIRFRDMAGYQSITSPSHADIGYCAGQCKAPLNAHNAHAVLHYALFKKGLVNKNPCCAPYDYEDFEYLTKNGTKLVRGIWKNAIATSCSCQ